MALYPGEHPVWCSWLYVLDVEIVKMIGVVAGRKLVVSLNVSW